MSNKITIQLPILELADMIKRGCTMAAINSAAARLGIPLETVKQIQEDIRAYGRPIMRGDNGGTATIKP